METIMPLYIQGVLGHSATVSGIAMLPGAVIGAFTGLLAGRLFDRYGVRRPVLIGAAGITVGLIGFASLQINTPIVAVAIIYAVMAIGMQFTMTPVNTWGVNSLPNDAIQHAQSTSNTINQVAASFGTALLVSVAATVSSQATSLTGLENTFFGYHAAFCTTALLAGVAVVLILTFVRDRKRAKAGASATLGSAAEAMPAPTGCGAVTSANAETQVASSAPGTSLAGTKGAAAMSQAATASPAGAAKAATVCDTAGCPAAAFPAPEPGEPSPAFVQVANEAFGELTLEQAMNPNAACVRDTATMGEVVELIAATDTTGVSVVDAAGKLVGYVTDGDIMRYLARLDMSVSNPSVGVSLAAKDVEDLGARIQALGGLNVMELATRRVVSVDVNTPLDVACGVLAKRKIKKVPVTRDGKLVGALSRRNILHAIITGEKLGS